MRQSENYSNINWVDGARGRNRTSDTRIFNPQLDEAIQALRHADSVKLGSAYQSLSPGLSNLEASTVWTFDNRVAGEVRPRSAAPLLDEAAVVGLVES